MAPVGATKTVVEFAQQAELVTQIAQPYARRRHGVDMFGDVAVTPAGPGIRCRIRRHEGGLTAT
jgi:hypothetical protein